MGVPLKKWCVFTGVEYEGLLACQKRLRVGSLGEVLRMGLKLVSDKKIIDI